MGKPMRPAPLRHLRQRPVRLLLIDDNDAVAEATAEFLRRAGLEVRIAESGQAGLAVAAGFRPEIILCDICLPDTSGIEVALSLRGQPDAQHALVAMHTAMSETDIRILEREVQADQVNLFLSKPLTEKKLNRLLDELADWQRRRQRTPIHRKR